MSSESRIWQMAIERAKEATELDSQKKYDAAFDKYLQAAEALNEFAKFSKNPKLKAVAEERAKQYIKRAQQVSDLLNKKQKIKVGGPDVKRTEARGRTQTIREMIRVKRSATRKKSSVNPLKDLL